MAKIRTKNFFPGQIIIREDEDVENAYVINEGFVEVYRKLAAGKVITIAKLGKGQIFGEMSLFGDKRSSASVKALTELEVQVIDKKILEYYLEQTPPLIKMLLEIFAYRLNQTSLKYLMASSNNTKTKAFLKSPDIERIDFGEGKARD